MFLNFNIIIPQYRSFFNISFLHLNLVFELFDCHIIQNYGFFFSEMTIYYWDVGVPSIS